MFSHSGVGRLQIRPPNQRNEDRFAILLVGLIYSTVPVPVQLVIVKLRKHHRDEHILPVDDGDELSLAFQHLQTYFQRGGM